ncbi:MAG: sulfotransferase family 2 domain-containing protein [Gammaproteobacteria bacterium]|nr:sulfotransferase family 2 domain-containing protein [Gammaproteobacteria bacterium]
MAGRKVILHYHLFKNAGTSIDHILKENFGEQQWRNQEFDFPGYHLTSAILSGQSTAPLVRKWLCEHPDALILSSHSAIMPVPELAATTVFPIVFVRHPLIRLNSSYVFQRSQFQEGIDNATTRLAQERNFAGYLEGLLDLRNQSLARNFNAVRLAAAVPGPPEQFKQRAMRALEALPFVGVVERFSQSLVVLQHWLEPHFPGFQAAPAWLNASLSSAVSPKERLADIEEQLGASLYGKVTEANQVDIEVHRAASQKIEARHAALGPVHPSN